jgi:hypothetical protein
MVSHIAFEFELGAVCFAVRVSAARSPTHLYSVPGA